MILKLPIIALGASCFLLAVNEPLQKVEIRKTERIDFPSGGVLRLTNSIGELTVEGWEKPQIEIATVKTTKHGVPAGGREKASAELEKVRITVERKGNEVSIATDFPRHKAWPPSAPFSHGTNFDLEYRIHAPRDTRLVVANHGIGEIHVDDLTSDIDVTLQQGEIMLHLPQDGRYAIDAKSDFGNVNCDFAGEEKRRRWLLGHWWVSENSPGSHKLNLKAGYGDVVILKTRVPAEPADPGPGAKSSGL
jgi:hypothetical protein